MHQQWVEVEKKRDEHAERMINLTLNQERDRGQLINFRRYGEYLREGE